MAFKEENSFGFRSIVMCNIFCFLLLSEARILEVLRELGLLATRSLEICAGSAHWSTGMNNMGLHTEKHDICVCFVCASLVLSLAIVCLLRPVCPTIVRAC